MLIVRTNGTQTLVARGMTKIQESAGFNTPVFFQTRTNALRIAYQVAEPVAAPTNSTVNDGLYVAVLRFGVCLRNALE